MPALAPDNVWDDPRERGVPSSAADDLQALIMKLSDCVSVNKDFLDFQYARERNDHAQADAALKRLAAKLEAGAPLARRIQRAVVAARPTVATKE
jgi:hypothetical protein